MINIYNIINEALDKGINREIFSIGKWDDYLNTKDNLTDKDKSHLLINHPDRHIKRVIADDLKNFDIDKTMQHKVFDKRKEDVKSSDNTNYTISRNFYNLLSSHSLLPELKNKFIHNHADYGDEDSPREILNNPSLTSDELHTVIDKVKSSRDSFTPSDFRAIIYDNPNTTDEHVTKLIDDKNIDDNYSNFQLQNLLRGNIITKYPQASQKINDLYS